MDSFTSSLDDVSADGSTEYPERSSSMEVRLQAQEDEITLLKSSLADALRRIRMHDQLLPLLRQQLIAVNPSAARVLNQVCHSDGCTGGRKLSTSSANDGIYHASTAASQQSQSIVNKSNGHIGGVTSAEPQSRPPSSDKATQTEPAEPPPSGRVQALLLEDGLPRELEGTRGNLQRIPGVEEVEDEDQLDERAGGDQDKEMSWASSVEEPIQPTSVKSLQREELQNRSCSPDESGSGPASLGSDTNLSSRSGPLSPIQEGEKTLCVSAPHRCFTHDKVHLFLSLMKLNHLYYLDSANPSLAADLIPLVYVHSWVNETEAAGTCDVRTSQHGPTKKGE